MRKEIMSDDARISTSGRIYRKGDTVYFDWSCSFIEFDMEGEYAAAGFVTEDPMFEENFRAWIGIFINGELTRKVRLDETLQTVELYKGEKKRVRIRVMKLSESAFARCGFNKIVIDGELLAAPAPEHTRKIEFVGDSITCGYGVDGTYMVDVFKTETEDPMKAYAYLTATKCRAQYQYVSWSGMGVRTAYVDENTEEPLDTWLFKDIYPYIDSNLEKKMGKESHSEHTKYDFSFKPHVIVFAEGTNDHSWTRKKPERIAEFCKEYYDMLTMIRQNNSDSYIVCTYGVMGNDLEESIKDTVEKFRSEYDDRICYVPLTPQDEENDGVVVDWHPSAKTHEKVSQTLSKVIGDIFEKAGL